MPLTSPLRLALTLSLMVNLLLTGGWIWRATSQRGWSAGQSGLTTTAPGATTERVTEAKSATPAVGAHSSVEDPKALRDALRAAGGSEKLVRRYVRDAVWAKYQHDDSEKRKREWWKQSPYSNRLTTVPSATVKAVEAETRALVGDDGSDAVNSDQMTFLPAEKRPAVMRILSDYNEMVSGIRAEMMDFQMPDDEARLELLMQECSRDLQAVLSPAEFAEMSLRQSPAWHRAQMIAGQLDLTEAEFYEVVKLRSEADKLAAQDPKNAMIQNKEIERRFEDELTQLVGAERIRAQSEKNSRDYEVLQKAQSRLGFSQEVFAGVLGQRDQAKAAAAEIEASSLPVKEKREALRKLAVGVKAEVARLLGPAAAEGYFRQNGMPWVRDLERGYSLRFTTSGWVESVEVK
jgi:hypothetical protein